MTETERGQAMGRLPVVPASGQNISATADQYKRDMLAARGNRNKLVEIKERYRKAGIDVDLISLLS